ncbi:MAG: helix-turn-helix domain-containing protein [Anaerolineae bacterium]|nr:helix-turn-helix domain-containing protein [Anaerolineae bacterium]
MDLPAHDNDVTLGDLIRLALPFGTMVSTGPGQLGREVAWVVTLIDWSNLSEQVQARDVVLLPPALQEQTADPALAAHLEALAAQHAAALVIFKDVSARVKKAALKLDFPILVLPANTALRYVQRVTTSLLLDRQAQTTERGMELYRRLSEMSLEERGLEALASLMMTVTGKIVVIQDKRLDVRALAVPPGNEIDVGELTAVLAQRDSLPTVLRNRKAAAKTHQSYWQQILPIENVGRLVAPIISGDRARGYVSVVGPAGELDLLDSLTAEQGAVASALEMAKAKAVSEAEKALRGDFLEGLLAGTLPRKEIERLESRLDHDTSQPHVIMTFTWAAPDLAPGLAHLETTIHWLLSSHKRPALMHNFADDHIVVFPALTPEEERAEAAELDRRLREHVQVEYGEEYDNVRIISGLSGPTAAIHEWPIVHQQALQAMDLARRLHANHLVEYNSLGIYQLLSQIEHIDTVQRFAEQIIGPLAEYDRRHRGSLVETIDAYFQHHANVSQTAESLFIHRNTLLYRLERIQELTGQDINQADMRLALQLALKLWQLRLDT